MIFVDQPINTGFSYSDDPRDRVHDEQGVAEDMLDFLLAFYDAFPHLQENAFFVTGESYAGHYVPAVASRVFNAVQSGEADINLQGFAIGNGLTNPAVQYSAYADYALDNGLIDKRTRDRIQMLYPICRMGASVCAGHNWKTECLIALQFCQVAIWDRIMAQNPNINVYDITKTCDAPLCYDFSLAEKFLNLPQVQEALGVDREWEMCDPGVYRDMMGDWLKNLDAVIPPMLEAGVRVMVYAGDLDLICNWLGNYRWVSALPWSGRMDFASAEMVEWEVDGEAAGMVQGYGPLSFVKVYQAGHMVPMDQPAAALHMITHFTNDEPLTKKAKKLATSESSKMISA
jgi:carboxypeptidase C (cathepsin A)